MSADFIGPIDLPPEFTAARHESWHHFLSRMRRRHVAHPVNDDLQKKDRQHVWPKGPAHWCGQRPGKKWMSLDEYERRKNLSRSFLKLPTPKGAGQQ